MWSYHMAALAGRGSDDTKQKGERGGERGQGEAGPPLRPAPVLLRLLPAVRTLNIGRSIGESEVMPDVITIYIMLPIS